MPLDAFDFFGPTLEQLALATRDSFGAREKELDRQRDEIAYLRDGLAKAIELNETGRHAEATAVMVQALAFAAHPDHR